VISADFLRLKLTQHYTWMPSFITLNPKDKKRIPLEVLSIDTGAGEVKFRNHVVIGYIVADDSILLPVSTRVIITFIEQKVYQSALQRTLIITGRGFFDDMVIYFDPPIKLGTDYTLDVSSKKTKATLTLISGRKWRQDAGSLAVVAVQLSNHESWLIAGGAGRVVADVYLDPTIEASNETFHQSQSKVHFVLFSRFASSYR
jgi:hypothetical protein